MTLECLATITVYLPRRLIKWLILVKIESTCKKIVFPLSKCEGQWINSHWKKMNFVSFYALAIKRPLHLSKLAHSKLEIGRKQQFKKQ